MEHLSQCVANIYCVSTTWQVLKLNYGNGLECMSAVKAKIFYNYIFNIKLLEEQNKYFHFVPSRTSLIQSLI